MGPMAALIALSQTLTKLLCRASEYGVTGYSQAFAGSQQMWSSGRTTTVS